jgi:hypothetical protein
VSELEGYLKELHVIAPQSFEEFRQIEKKRACERLLQPWFNPNSIMVGVAPASKLGRPSAFCGKSIQT